MLPIPEGMVNPSSREARDVRILLSQLLAMEGLAVTNIKLTEEQKQKLILLGLQAVLEKVDLLDFPTPVRDVVRSSNGRTRKWTAAQRRKFIATMKRKRAAEVK